MAPQPGRINLPGMSGGGVAAGTAGAAMTGSIKTAAPLVFVTAGISRKLGTMMARAMTSTDLGALRTAQRAIALAPLAGKNAAAAEALRGLMVELDEWDKREGGDGFGWEQ